MTPGPPKYIRHYMGVAWSLLRSAEDQRERVLVHGGVDGLEQHVGHLGDAVIGLDVNFEL